MREIKNLYLSHLEGRIQSIAYELTRVSYRSAPATDTWHPAINAYRCQQCILICVELAGVDRTAIQLQVEPRRLSLRGRRAPLEPQEPPVGPPLQVLAMEIDEGSFERTIVLPADVEHEKAQAEQREGLLWIRLPLAQPC